MATADRSRLALMPMPMPTEAQHTVSVETGHHDAITKTGWPPVTGGDPGAGPVVINPSEQMASSMIGAFLTSMLVTPFDVVKTRLQHQAWETPRTEATKCGTCGRIYILKNGLMEHVVCGKRGLEPPNCKPAGGGGAKFSGTVDAFMRIYRNEGAGALWRGLPPTLLMAVPQTVIYFTAYDQLKARLGTENPYYAPLIAGPVARTFAVSIISPIEMVRTKIQAESVTPAARDYWRLVTNAVKTDGVLSLWRGLGATLLRDVPFSAFYWLGYERLQPRFAQRFAAGAPANAPPQEAGDATLLAASFAAGAASGTVAAAVTLPFDVVKTRQQTFLGETMIGVRTRCGGPIAVMRDIVRTQGAQGLFVGLTPRIAKVAPACAIMISSYEAGKAFFARQHHAAALDLINGVQ